MPVPKVGDRVIYHPGKNEGYPAGMKFEAVVSGVDNNADLALDVFISTQSRNKVTFLEDDRGALPEGGYATVVQAPDVPPQPAQPKPEPFSEPKSAGKSEAKAEDKKK